MQSPSEGSVGKFDLSVGKFIEEILVDLGEASIFLDKVAAGGEHEIRGTLDENVEFSFVIFVAGGHLLLLGAEGEDLFYSVSVSELLVVVAHSVGDLEEGALGFVADLVDFKGLSSFLDELGVSAGVVADSQAEQFGTCI